jgi:hypothetical protein
MRGDLLTPPRLRNAKIPKALNDIIMKAMAPDVHARYQRAGDLLDDVLAAGAKSARRPVRAREGESHDVHDIQTRLKARETPQPRFLLAVPKAVARRSGAARSAAKPSRIKSGHTWPTCTSTPSGCSRAASFRGPGPQRPAPSPRRTIDWPSRASSPSARLTMRAQRQPSRVRSPRSSCGRRRILRQIEQAGIALPRRGAPPMTCRSIDPKRDRGLARQAFARPRADGDRAELGRLYRYLIGQGFSPDEVMRAPRQKPVRSTRARCLLKTTCHHETRKESDAGGFVTSCPRGCV